MADESVDDDRRPESQKFLAITDSGTIETAEAVIEVNDEDEDGFVVVTFDESIVEAAATFSIEAGAVEGLQGDQNPRNTLSAEEAADDENEPFGFLRDNE